MENDVGKCATPKLVLDRVRPERNERRFYALSVTDDLFGITGLFRNWGRIGTGGRVRFDPYTKADEAEAALRKLAQAKIRRGYQNRI